MFFDIFLFVYFLLFTTHSTRKYLHEADVQLHLKTSRETRTEQNFGGFQYAIVVMQSVLIIFLWTLPTAESRSPMQSQLMYKFLINIINIY